MAVDLVGTWRLVSFERVGGTSTEYPFGRDAAGYLHYDATGYMSVQIMRRGRPEFASGDQTKASTEEMRAAIGGYAAYYGTYRVDETKPTPAVIHHLEGSLLPNWIGSDQLRHIELEAGSDRLVLTTPAILFDGRQSALRVVWQRVPAKTE